MGLYFCCNGVSMIAISKSSKKWVVVMARTMKPTMFIKTHDSELQGQEETAIICETKIHDH